MDEQELAAAQRLLWELHRLGGPSPQGMEPAEIIRRYQQLLASEAAQPEPGGGTEQEPDSS